MSINKDRFFFSQIIYSMKNKNELSLNRFSSDFNVYSFTIARTILVRYKSNVKKELFSKSIFFYSRKE